MVSAGYQKDKRAVLNDVYAPRYREEWLGKIEHAVVVSVNDEAA